MRLPISSIEECEARICRLAELDDFTFVREHLIELSTPGALNDYSTALLRFVHCLTELHSLAASR